MKQQWCVRLIVRDGVIEELIQVANCGIKLSRFILHAKCRMLLKINILKFLLPAPWVYDFQELKNSMVWVRERTISTERPPLVGKVIANLSGYRVPRGQRDGSLRPYPRISRQEPLLFYQVAPQLLLTRLSGPRSRPTSILLYFFFPENLVVPGIEPGLPDL
jgi:hypothetical protein